MYIMERIVLVQRWASATEFGRRAVQSLSSAFHILMKHLAYLLHRLQSLLVHFWCVVSIGLALACVHLGIVVAVGSVPVSDDCLAHADEGGVIGELGGSPGHSSLRVLQQVLPIIDCLHILRNHLISWVLLHHSCSLCFLQKLGEFLVCQWAHAHSTLHRYFRNTSLWELRTFAWHHCLNQLKCLILSSLSSSMLGRRAWCVGHSDLWLKQLLLKVASRQILIIIWNAVFDMLSEEVLGIR